MGEVNASPTSEVHVRKRGMYWDDLREIIRRNAAPNTAIQYYYNPKQDPDSIFIFDRLITRRKPERLALTGATQTDEWRDSMVCRAGFFSGMIPMDTHTGQFNTDPSNEFGKMPMFRGALSVIEQLIVEGCVRRNSDEIRSLFREHGRDLPTPA